MRAARDASSDALPEKVAAADPGSVADFQGWAKMNAGVVLKEQRQVKDEADRALYIHVIERTNA